MNCRSLQSLSAAKFIAISNVFLIYLIYIPLIIYYGLKFYKKRKHVALVQRYGFITILEIVCCSIKLSTWAFESILQTCMGISYQDEFKPAYKFMYYILIFAINTPFTLLCSLWVWRFWMIRYDIKFMVVNIGYNVKQWMYIINPIAMHSVKSKWYLNKKSTFGNLKWIGYYFVLPWNIFWMFYVIIRSYFGLCKSEICNQIEPIMITISQGTAWFPWIILLIIYYKIPIFHDKFFISKELRRLIIIAIIGLFLAIFIRTYIFFISDIYLEIGEYTFNLVATSTVTGMSLISTWWVLRQLKSIQIINNNRDIPEKSSNSIYDKLSNSYDYDGTKAMELKQILQNKELFESYMIYLSKELSIQFLLAFIEIIQMQKYILQQNIVDLFDEDRIQHSLFHQIEFYHGIVASSIVYQEYDEYKDNDEILKEIKRKSTKLYQKYIEYGAEYEIIVSKSVHNKISDIMSHLDWIDDDEYNMNDILELWDDISKELFILLMNGFNRFQKTY